jgi:hypothetical protein
MAKHEIIVRGALRIYTLIISNTFNQYPFATLTIEEHRAHVLKYKTRAIIAHDRHLTRFTK